MGIPMSETASMQPPDSLSRQADDNDRWRGRVESWLGIGALGLVLMFAVVTGWFLAMGMP